MLQHWKGHVKNSEYDAKVQSNNHHGKGEPQDMKSQQTMKNVKKSKIVKK